MSAPHDGVPADIEALFDQIGDWEWLRLDSDIRGRVAFALHRRLLARYLTSGMRVLEVGAGPGRFTIALAQMGCRVVVSDVSSVQLALNEEHVNAADVADSIEDRVQLDVRDLSRFGDGSFDAVVAYGGPLSYVFEDASGFTRMFPSHARSGTSACKRDVARRIRALLRRELSSDHRGRRPGHISCVSR